MYLEVWKDSTVKLGDVTSATDVARSGETSAPSAPRHWEALQAAPTAACQALGLESYTEGNALFCPVLPLPCFLLRSFFPSSLPGFNTPVPPVIAILFTEGYQERIVPLLVTFRQPEVLSGIIQKSLDKFDIIVTDALEERS